MMNIDLNKAGQLATIILAVITGYYAYLTQKLVHIPHRTFIKPISILTRDDKYSISLKNIGNSTAYDVTVKIGILDENRLKGIFTELHGSFEIQPNEEKLYTINYSFFRVLLHYPVKITWRTMSGKKYSEIWRYNIDKTGVEVFTKFPKTKWYCYQALRRITLGKLNYFDKLITKKRY